MRSWRGPTGIFGAANEKSVSTPIDRIAPSGQITKFGGLNLNSDPDWISPGPDGNLWFTDQGSTRAVGRVTPSGQVAEFSAGLPPGSIPSAIAPGPDGNVQDQLTAAAGALPLQRGN